MAEAQGRIDGWRNDFRSDRTAASGFTARVFRASVLHHSDPQAVEHHCPGVLCLDNAFALIERHPQRGSGEWRELRRES